MPILFKVFLAGVAVAFVCTSAAAAGKKDSSQWIYFHFEGGSFVAGKPAEGVPFVAMREGVQPVLLTKSAKIEAVKLAPGTGALVGICYIQSSGGKLKRSPSYLPCPRVPVQILQGDKVVATVETDAQGYFLATLPAGKYQVRVKDTIETTVNNGKTTLVQLRAGKRMVD
jgi:hypothetical protein